MLDLSSHFLRHEPCPKCGSKDNLAVYSSGTGYCFGCGFFTRLSDSGGAGSTHTMGGGGCERGAHSAAVRSYPDDVNREFPKLVVQWIAKYHLTPADLIRHNVFWSPQREQLIYTFYGAGNDVVLWQARNFREGTTHKHRFFTGGSPEDVIATYSTGETRSTCIVVEDCISGIKVSYAGVDGIPCFSASLSRQKLAGLARIYKQMLVWLDNDKYSSAQKIALQGAALGLTTRVVFTPLDPKEYTVEEILDIIK